MPYQIKGERQSGGGIGEWAESAHAALKLARQWASQGVQNITITNPKRETYDLDRFGMIASTKEESEDADRT